MGVSGVFLHLWVDHDGDYLGWSFGWIVVSRRRWLERGKESLYGSCARYGRAFEKQN